MSEFYLDIYEKLIKYRPTTHLDLNLLEQDAIRMASCFISTTKLSIVLLKFRQKENIPIFENFHRLLSVIPEEHIFKSNLFANYDEYEEYLFTVFYFKQPKPFKLLPTIDQIIFILIQYYDDEFDKPNGNINLNSPWIFNEIPFSYQKTTNYIKKVFEVSYKKYIMLTDFNTTSPLVFAIFSRVNLLIQNGFYSIRAGDWELIQSFDLTNQVMVDSSLVKRKKKDFINLFGCI